MLSDADRLDVLEKGLYSAFPALLATGIRIWMVNLRAGSEIAHGEGKTFRAAIDNAVVQRDKEACDSIKQPAGTGSRSKATDSSPAITATTKR